MSDPKTAYDAVYAYINELDDYTPPDPAHRNAVIWRAVQAALEAESAMWERRVREVLEIQADRIRDLHTPAYAGPDNTPQCNTCRTGEWPCPTLRALEGQ